MRILLVEDDEAVGSAVREHAEADGHAVDWAKDLAEARHCASVVAYEFTLLDILLPDGNGVDYLRETVAAGLPAGRNLGLAGCAPYLVGTLWPSQRLLGLRPPAPTTRRVAGMMKSSVRAGVKLIHDPIMRSVRAGVGVMAAMADNSRTSEKENAT
ncbi:hypothetical protein [Sinorhizobium medicae]|uniref:hypothetical protein n=1 Tax=Sinorhizobium medicae TaxID=110321 RepID=UPI001F1CE615|nr:hypothetical protein [Sinorhizobium medicae]